MRKNSLLGSALRAALDFLLFAACVLVAFA